jgi:TLD
MTIDSKICTTPDESNYLKSLFPNGKTPVLDLLYRGSRDGWKFVDFHSRCDNKGATVTMFLTDQGLKCGGYTSQSWDTSGGWKHDSESFVFTLTKQ